MQVNIESHSRNENLYNLCQQYNNSQRVNIILDAYNFDQTLMRDCEKVPYIIRKGKIEWAVDIKSITIAEYVNTFPHRNLSKVNFSTGYHCGNKYQKQLQCERENFEIFWKKVLKEWRDVECSWREKKRFLKRINQYPVSPMSVVQVIYDHGDYNLKEFSEVFSCNAKDAKAILKCLGFRNLYVKDLYECEHSFKKAVLESCQSAANCFEDIQPSIQARIRRGWFYILENVKVFLERKADKASLRINCNTERVEPARGERKRSWENVVYVLTVVLMLLFVVWGIVSVSNYLKILFLEKDFAVWQESTSSFLGGMIGAIISGIATIVTTYLVIQRSYKIDYHRERMDAMPVFTAECFTGKQISKKHEQYFRANVQSMFVVEHEIYENPCCFVVKNIGNGIAFHVKLQRHPRDCEKMYLNTMEINGEKGIMLSADEHRKLILQYQDLYGNQYVQYISMYNEDGQVVTTAHRPELIMRTKRARYVQ